jgi:molecular chaperone DnaK (HSP70)
VDAGITLEQISSVEVVGGSSRIPVIITKLSEVLNKEPSRTLNAKECVARGAALQAAMLSPTFKCATRHAHHCIHRPVCDSVRGIPSAGKHS